MRGGPDNSTVIKGSSTAARRLRIYYEYSQSSSLLHRTNAVWKCAPCYQRLCRLMHISNSSPVCINRPGDVSSDKCGHFRKSSSARRKYSWIFRFLVKAPSNISPETFEKRDDCSTTRFILVRYELTTIAIIV